MRVIIREMLQAACLFSVVFLLLHLSVQNLRIDGSSMDPTLINTQHLIASKLAYLRFDWKAVSRILSLAEGPGDRPSLLATEGPSHGDVIAFLYPLDPSQEFVKRVIGIPGDVIAIESGQVIRNGRVLDEPYVVHRDRQSHVALTVPANSYYVLGDNRRGSTDSRDWGLVPESLIIGRVWVSYWPSERLGAISPFW